MLFGSWAFVRGDLVWVGVGCGLTCYFCGVVLEVFAFCLIDCLWVLGASSSVFGVWWFVRRCGCAW